MDSRLVGARAKIEVDGEWLSSSHDKAISAVQLCAVACVIELACKVPSANVKSWVVGEEQGRINESEGKNISLGSRNVSLLIRHNKSNL